MDITNFMTWWIGQVVNIFSKYFNILDSIQFAGTSLLKVMITLCILVPLISVILTIGHSASVVSERAEKINQKREKVREKKK